MNRHKQEGPRYRGPSCLPQCCTFAPANRCRITPALTQQQHPEFLQAIQEGRQLSTLWWEERALDMAQGKPGNAMIVSLGLRNRSRAASGWHHDVQRLEHSGPDGGPIKSASAQPLDLSALPYHLREELRAVLVAQLAKANTKLIDGSYEEE